jgi:histidinol-phosphate aminotransferase
MTISRRGMLSASALLLAGPGFALRAGAASDRAQQRPIVLCWNENPYGPSPAARVAARDALAGSCRYPTDQDINALVTALAARVGVGADHIVTGSGSGELLCALGLLYAGDGAEIVAAEPTYTELTEYAKRRGATVRWVPLDAQLRHDLPAMHAAVSERTRAIYVCNPNNPTGTTVPVAQLRDFVHSMPASVTTIVDEAYLDFVDDPGAGTVVDLVQGGRVVVLRTFSKIHGMAGLRCGYAIARPELVTTIAGARMSYPNICAVRAAHASLADQVFLADCRRRILASRARITAALARRKLPYAEPQGNFVFFDTGMPLSRFTAFMAERHILVGRHFPRYDNWCRITIGTEPEVSAFLAALRELPALA